MQRHRVKKTIIEFAGFVMRDTPDESVIVKDGRRKSVDEGYSRIGLRWGRWKRSGWMGGINLRAEGDFKRCQVRWDCVALEEGRFAGEKGLRWEEV
jgi:hypothetical protein